MVLPNSASGVQIYSYILRMWLEDEDEQQVWRASLTPIPKGERIGFVSLQAAFQFVEEQIRRASKEEEVT